MVDTGCCVDAKHRRIPGFIVPCLDLLPRRQCQPVKVGRASFDASPVQPAIAADHLDIDEPGVTGLCALDPGRPGDRKRIHAVGDDTVSCGQVVQCEGVGDSVTRLGDFRPSSGPIDYPGRSHRSLNRVDSHVYGIDLVAEAARERGLAYSRKTRQGDERGRELWGGHRLDGMGHVQWPLP